MIGVFLKNNSGKLCFLQPWQEKIPEISAFHYVQDTHKVDIVLENGDQETPPMEIAPEIRDAFLEAKNILVVDLDEQNVFQREYKVPLTLD